MCASSVCYYIVVLVSLNKPKKTLFLRFTHQILLTPPQKFTQSMKFFQLFFSWLPSISMTLTPIVNFAFAIRYLWFWDEQQGALNVDNKSFFTATVCRRFSDFLQFGQIGIIVATRNCLIHLFLGAK